MSGKSDLDSFIRLPWTIYRHDPAWSPPLILERREHLNPDKNPYFQHAEAALWLAYRDGACVGRISAQICRLHLEAHDNTSGQFGFIEAIDDAEVFSALFEAAADWLRQRGMRRMLGPFNFSINDEMGLLIDGFDEPPRILMSHARPYYQDRIEALGLTKAKDVYAYDYMLRSEFPPAAKAVMARAAKQGKIEIRPMNKADFKNEIALVVDIFNDAWSENWGFVPMTDAEVQVMADNLKLLVTGGFGQIASVDGEPAAMLVSLPDVNHTIRDLNGRLLPFGWAKIIWRLKIRKPTQGRIPLMGVRKKFQHGVLGAGLALRLIEAIDAYHGPRGAKRAELSWVLEDNGPMNALAKLVGAKPYKTYRIYERQL
ncbi:MAG: N-acetyltransferase [Hyphomicrobiales bacterium]|nr:MAG: N-acetyltransferase [Hyphomicrobiales bacterium]